jgi:hypothetical protein
VAPPLALSESGPTERGERGSAPGADMTEDAALLRRQAEQCRRLANAVTAPDVVETLLKMADDYIARAERIEGGESAR